MKILRYDKDFVERMLHRTVEICELNKNVNPFLELNIGIYFEDQ